MKDSGLRLLHMLKLIPRYPSSISAKEMLDKLTNVHSKYAGITEKQIKRNFASLQGYSDSIVSLNDVDYAPRTRENRYCWDKDAPNVSLEHMDVSTAAMLLLGYEQLDALIPTEIRMNIQPFIREANNVLSKNGLNDKSWNKKVRVLHSTPLNTAKLKHTNFHNIYDALLQEKQFSAKYNAYDRAVFNPLGLIQRNHALYLVCTYDQGKKLYILALHRFEEAQKGEKRRLAEAKVEGLNPSIAFEKIC